MLSEDWTEQIEWAAHQLAHVADCSSVTYTRMVGPCRVDVRVTRAGEYSPQDEVPEAVQGSLLDG
jgi:hypothetical protein